MGIFKRVKTIAAADINGLLDRFEDPVDMLKQYIRELEEQMDKAREALAFLLASEQHYRLLVAKAKELVSKRSRQAELAVDKDEDGIAEIAIQDKLKHAALLADCEEQLAAIGRQIEALQEELGRMAALHQELRSKLESLMIRAHAAQAVAAAASAAPSFKTDEMLRNVSRIESKVWRMEAGAKASRLASAASESLKRWEQRDEVQAELEKLKAARDK